MIGSFLVVNKKIDQSNPSLAVSVIVSLELTSSDQYVPAYSAATLMCVRLIY